MTAPDPTEELIRAMLERRGGRPGPAWLRERTLRQVGAARQAKRPWWRVRIPERRAPRAVLVAVPVLLLVAIVVGGLAAGGLLDRAPGAAPTGPAGVLIPSGASLPSALPSGSSPAPSAMPGSTPPPAPAIITPDSMAVVTPDGAELRVRSAPGLGQDSTKLEPLLPTGTRMLVISGPVRADSYDWFEVLTDGEPADLYGWVAAGKNGVDWIEPAAPRCASALDATAIATLRRVDFLVCYGGAELTIPAHRRQGSAAPDRFSCPFLGERTDCVVDQQWLFQANWPIAYTTTTGEEGLLSVAQPPGARSSIADVPAGGSMTLTVALDAPEAKGCRVRDPATGNDLVPPNRAATACRLIFVVHDVAW